MGLFWAPFSTHVLNWLMNICHSSFSYSHKIIGHGASPQWSLQGWWPTGCYRCTPFGVISARDAPAKHNVPLEECAQCPCMGLPGIDAERTAANQASLTESVDRRQVACCVPKFMGAPIQECHGCIHWELMEAFVQSATADIHKNALYDGFGPSKASVQQFKKRALAALNVKSLNLLKRGCALKQMSVCRWGDSGYRHSRKQRKPLSASST